MEETLITFYDKASYTIYRILKVIPNNIHKTGWSAYNNYREIMTLYVYIMHIHFGVSIEDIASCLNIKAITCNVYRNNLDRKLMKHKYPNIQTYLDEYDSAKVKVFK
jgi:hypothetical protein